MKFKGSTVLLLVCLAIVLSSLITMMIFSASDQETVRPATDQQGQEIGKQPGEHALPSDEQFAKIAEAYEIIHENYVLEMDQISLIEGAIEGMINALDDPYSAYMDPETANQFFSSLQSSFEGIGAEVMMKDGKVTVVSPIRGTPAEKAGIRPNDQILSVNGKSVDGLDLNQAVMEIRGPKGTEAKLEISRPGFDELLTVTVIRDEIPLETVYSDTIRANGKQFGKIEITSFAEKTAEDFAQALQAFEEAGMDGLVIDVRGNPGGYLEAVRDIGQLLIPDEQIITEIENRDGQKVIYRSSLKDKKPYPITILINQGSASASEILAAALQEAGQYQVVGTNSFGKGTVQSTIPMGDSSQIKITIAKWLTPDENWIHEVGVTPNVEIEQPDYFLAAPIRVGDSLQKGEENSNVSNLQLVLRGMGYSPGNDGVFTNQVEQAVKQFQADHQLQATGLVDEETANMIHEKLFEMIRDPQNDIQLQKAIEVLLKEL